MARNQAFDARVTAATRFVSGGSAITLNPTDHSGKTILLNALTGTTVTLPTPTGSGIVFTIMTSVLATSNSHVIKVAGATDYMNGALVVVNDATGACTPFGTTGSTTTRSDTITLNRTTTGLVAVGERILIEDIAAGNWSVTGTVIGTGTIATPFSATV